MSGLAARTARVLAASACLGATAVAVHTAVNVRLLRDPHRARTAVGPEAPPAAASGDAAGPPPVSVLVPARDEAARIGGCVRSVLASRGVRCELLVLDDASLDGTADAARAAAGGDLRLRVLRGRPLPPGWLGKPHACARLADEARGEVLVFVDADVRLDPDGLAATVAQLAAGPFDLVSPYPRQVAEGPGPRLVQPLLQWSWLAFLPLRAAERWPRPSLVAANGQVMATTRAAYREVGGHAAVRGAVLDDMELARAYVRAGRRAGVVDGTAVAACQMYESWADAREGYAKSLWAAFGSARSAAGVITLLFWLFVVPPAAFAAGVARRRPGLAALGAGGYAAGVAGRVLAARRTAGRPGDAIAHPVSVLALAWLVVRSFAGRRTGRLAWRGRPVDV